MQGSIAGGTDYSFKTSKEILDDIISWINSSDKLIRYNETFSANHESNKIWQLVPYNFKASINQCTEFWKTAYNDLTLIKQAIELNQITSKEINLLIRIGQNALKLNNALGIDFNENMRLWHIYGDPDFSAIERLYEENRDYCATFMDASNVATRLKDYEVTSTPNIRYVGTDSSVNVSINGDVNCAQIQIGNNLNYDQNVVISQSMPFDSILSTLSSVKDEIVKFNDQNSDLLKLYEKAIIEAQTEKKPSKLKETLENLNCVAKKIGAYVIENAVKGILSYISEKYGL